MPRIILDAARVPGVLQHFHIKVGALFQTFGFEEFSFLFKFFELFLQFLPNVGDRDFQFLLRGDEMFGREKFKRGNGG